MHAETVWVMFFFACYFCPKNHGSLSYSSFKTIFHGSASHLFCYPCSEFPFMFQLEPLSIWSSICFVCVFKELRALFSLIYRVFHWYCYKINRHNFWTENAIFNQKIASESLINTIFCEWDPSIANSCLWSINMIETKHISKKKWNTIKCHLWPLHLHQAVISKRIELESWAWSQIKALWM